MHHWETFIVNYHSVSPWQSAYIVYPSLFGIKFITSTPQQSDSWLKAVVFNFFNISHHIHDKSYVDTEQLTLNIKENNFFSVTIVVLCTDDVFSSILKFHSIDYKCVVITSITLHELNTLLELRIIVEPGQCGCSNCYDTAGELGTLSFISKCTLWLYHKPWSSLSSICNIYWISMYLWTNTHA